MTILHDLLFAYWIILLIRVFASWFPVPPSGPVRRAYDIIWGLTEPVLKPVRGLIPMVQVGSAGLDLSPIIVFLILGILLSVI